MHDTTTKLSVLVTTYNHAPYVEAALRSALTQDTAFDYEVVVADDCSTDGTTEILRRIQAEYPDRVRLELHERNVGRIRNFEDGYRACRGQYLALLDGDDYWISPHKLQRQANFLDSRAECSICFHNVLVTHEDGSPEQLACGPDQKEFTGVEDLLIENYIPTCSVMYRHGLVRRFPDWTDDLITSDWALHLLHAQFGRVGYLNDTMGVYRKHAGGVWSGAAPRVKVDATIQMLEFMNEHFMGKYDGVVRASIGRWRSIYRLEDLHATFRQVETEWQRQLEQLRLERTAAVNEAYAQLREAERDRLHLSREVEQAAAEKQRLADEKAAALDAVGALRRESEEQRVALTRLEDGLEALVAGDSAQAGAILESLSGVDRRLADIYRWVDVQRTRELVEAVVPADATVLVVSKGDDELLRLGRRTAWHFPRMKDGTYTGSHPADDDNAITHLRDLIAQGAEYLVFPASTLWWLEHYRALADELRGRYRVVLDREGCCLIVQLEAPRAASSLAESSELTTG